MQKKLQKLLPFLPLTVIILALSFAVIYLFQTRQITFIETNINQEEKNDETFDKIVIFPTFNHYDFYEDLRIENEKAIINHDMIAKIINYVIKEARIPHGSISYNYNLIDSETLHLTFKWFVDEKIYRHSYLFKIKN